MTDTELKEVYRTRVLEHSRNPHNYGSCTSADRKAQGFNPLCGDKVTVYVQLDSNEIQSVEFEGSGCAISIASASMMTDALKGKSVADARKLIEAFRQLFKQTKTDPEQGLNDAKALEGVKNYPSRIKCATLAWSTFEAALDQEKNRVSTE